MAQVFEAFDSGDGEIVENADGGRHARKWIVLEEASLNTAANLVRAAAPLTHQSIDSGELLIRLSMSHKRLGIDGWEFTVNYGSEDGGGGSAEPGQPPPEPGTWQFSFDTTGGRATKTHAPLISRHWKSGAGDAPDLKGAINFHGERPEGVEVVIPNLRFTITAWYEARDITTNFMKELARKTGSVNNDTWLGFAAGEILYHGGQGQGDVPTVAGQRVRPIALNHQYEASENQASVSVTGIDAGSPGATIAKKGWEYMWIRTIKKIVNNVIGCENKHVYVNDPYEKKLAFRDFFGFG